MDERLGIFKLNRKQYDRNDDGPWMNDDALIYRMDKKNLQIFGDFFIHIFHDFNDFIIDF
jgi:hypothetical protein